MVEFPQSGDRFRGKENFSTWRGEYPAEFIEFELRSLRGEGDIWVGELQIRYEEGGVPLPGVVILHFRGDLIDRETIYAAEAFPADPGRAQYADQSPLEATPGLPVRARAG